MEEEEEINAESSALAALTALQVVEPAHCNGPSSLGQADRRGLLAPSFWPFEVAAAASWLTLTRLLQQEVELRAARSRAGTLFYEAGCKSYG